MLRKHFRGRGCTGRGGCTGQEKEGKMLVFVMSALRFSYRPVFMFSVTFLAMLAAVILASLPRSLEVCFGYV